MNLLVCAKEVVDSSIELAFDETTRTLKEGWNIRRLDPADESAMRLGLNLKRIDTGTNLTVVQLGPPSAECWLRDAMAAGYDEALRIWDEGLAGLHSAGKALILARMADILGFDILFTGARSSDGGNGQVGPLIAAHLGLPCITSVISVEPGATAASATAIKQLSRGFQERVECPFPFVATIEAGGQEMTAPAPLTALLDALEKPVSSYDLARLGVAWSSVLFHENRLRFGQLEHVRPRLKPIPAPDAALPAFERIRRLVDGVLKSRGGKIVQKDDTALAEEIFQILLCEGWLDHLKKKER